MKYYKYIFGAGSHGRVVHSSLSRFYDVSEIIFIDQNPDIFANKLNGSRIISSEVTGTQIHIALGNNVKREEVSRRVPCNFFNVIDSSCNISKNISLGQGIFLGPNVVIQTGVSIGHHVIVNSGSVVEHDCLIENFVNVCSGVTTGGKVTLNDGCFIGPGVTILARRKIGKGSIVGGGSLVTRDIPDNVVAYGVPAKVIRHVSENDWKNTL